MRRLSSKNAWKEGMLKDLVFFQRGFDITKAQQNDGIIPVISSSGITSYHDEYKAKGPGIVIGRKGTLGSIHFTESDYWPHDTTLWSKSLNGNNPRFVYYFLHTINFKRFDVGNSNPTLNRNHIHDLPVEFPNLSIQGKIVAVLSSYDDLLENNRRRMKLLEEAVRLLYEEWFVRLRFPGRAHTKIEKGVPTGWHWEPLSELTSFLKRGITPHYDDDSEGVVINQKCIRGGRVNMSLARHQSREVAPERHVQKGDILINSTGEGTLGRVAQVKTFSENCTVDTHVTIVRPKPKSPIHYMGMAVLAMEPILSKMGRGATNQTELSPAAIGQMEVLLPTKTLTDQFEQFAEPVFEQLTNLTSQNIQLRTARELLLPRLMSGKIAV